MELKIDQLVLFPDGHREGYMEARWSERHQAFYTFIVNEEGRSEKVYSTTIITKPARKKKDFVPSKETCRNQIFPCSQNEYRYFIEDGCNGKIAARNTIHYYKQVAKSICYVDEDGNIFAPYWAL